MFWLGDFNYRINEAANTIKELCSKQEYSTLWEYDQVLLVVVFFSFFVSIFFISSVITENRNHDRMKA